MWKGFSQKGRLDAYLKIRSGEKPYNYHYVKNMKFCFVYVKYMKVLLKIAV